MIRRLPSGPKKSISAEPLNHYPLPSLCDFLDTFNGCHWFGEYLKDRHCEENLAFYLDVNRFTRLILDNERQALAKEIYQLYVEEGSPVPVNLPVSIVQPLSQKVQEGTCDKDVFNDARDHVLELMFIHYLGFRRTEFFMNWLLEERKNPRVLRKKWPKNQSGEKEVNVDLFPLLLIA
eukprot:TRINITY_DN9508_c0_g2_i5.p1 TRINITY_DN9508_c0_g2~~TRINITY_DN9508_c0_g2_i5.p1  ORF type:complete len:178 (-),score=5.66 TRINITY_DN9508_c0_g2_i5:250-783(-)